MLFLRKMDTKIRINNIQLFGYHGVDEKEKSDGQPFEIDIEVSPIYDESISDNLDNTINYSHIYDEVKNIFCQRKYNLIEYLANKIATAITDKYNVENCKVIIRKPDAPINGKFDSVEVAVLGNGCSPPHIFIFRVKYR